MNKDKHRSSFDVVTGYLLTSWSLLRKHALVLLVLVSIPLILDFVLVQTVFEDVRTLAVDSPATNIVELIDDLPASFGQYLLISLIIGAIMSGALIGTLIVNVRDKKSVSISDGLGLGLENFLDVFIMSLMVGSIVLAGLFLLLVPGIVAAFFLMFSIHARLDLHVSVSESMKISYQTVKTNWLKSLQLVLILVGLFVFADSLSRLLASVISSDAVDMLYTAISIPLSAFISLVFTVAYFDLKVALKDSDK